VFHNFLISFIVFLDYNFFLFFLFFTVLPFFHISLFNYHFLDFHISLLAVHLPYFFSSFPPSFIVITYHLHLSFFTAPLSLKHFLLSFTRTDCLIFYFLLLPLIVFLNFYNFLLSVTFSISPLLYCPPCSIISTPLPPSVPLNPLSTCLSVLESCLPLFSLDSYPTYHYFPLNPIPPTTIFPLNPILPNTIVLLPENLRAHLQLSV
jgi:hypothetical protein